MLKRIMVVIALAMLISIQGLAGSVPAAEFSADMVTLQGGQETLAKTFYKNGLYRMEASEQGKISITIGNTAENVIWVLDPEAKVYFEFRSGQAQTPGVGEVDEDVVKEIRDLGTESIHGYVCDKRQIVYKDPDMGVMTTWFSPKLQIALRMEYPNESMTIEYRNIREVPQPDSLFTLPQGYQKMTVPGM